MAADEIQLPDLKVIQRFSLAVRSATAPRAEVIAALESDLAWLTGAQTPAAPPPAAASATTATVAAAPLPPARKRSPRKVARSPRTPRPTSTSASDAEA